MSKYSGLMKCCFPNAVINWIEGLNLSSLSTMSTLRDILYDSRANALMRFILNTASHTADTAASDIVLPVNVHEGMV